MLKHRPPKPYKLLKFFVSFVTTVKSRNSATIWKKLRWKSRTFTHFKCITEIIKKFKSLYGFGGRCLNVREVCMDFEPCFKVHNLVSVYPKGMKLGQMTNLNVIFHVVVFICLSIGYNLKLAPVPCWISEWPIDYRAGTRALAQHCCMKNVAWKIGPFWTNQHGWANVHMLLPTMLRSFFRGLIAS